MTSWDEFAVSHCVRVITDTGARKMAKKRSPGERMPRANAETNPKPGSEKELREREAIAERQKLFNGLTPPPDRETLLDELARCFVQAAVTRLLKEQKMKQGG
jgi:hypothetical protein